jgi:hypothetical protein
VTKNEFMGWVPVAAKPEDDLCYLEGCPCPFVIRKERFGWRLLGDAYVHGRMELPKGLEGCSRSPIDLI